MKPIRSSIWPGVISLPPAMYDVFWRPMTSLTRSFWMPSSSNLDGLAALDLAGGGLEGAGDQVEQGALAGAVDAHDAGALTRRDAPGDVVENGLLAEGDRDVEQVHDILAEALHGHRLHRDRVAGRRLVLDQHVGRVDAELGLGRAGRGSAAQPGEFLLHQVLALGFGGGAHPVAFDALQDVGRIAALEGLDDAVVHLPGLVADLVEEPPVVGDDHEAARTGRPAVLEVPGEPGDALDVEVVGGLVEEDHVVVADEHGGERDPAALATGEVVDEGIPGDVPHEPADDVADLGVAGPDVFFDAADDGVADGLPGDELVRLVEDADGDAAPARHAPGVWLHAPRQQVEQGGLAVAVSADDADPVAFVEAGSDAVKNDASGKFEVQGLSPEQMCHRFPSLAAVPESPPRSRRTPAARPGSNSAGAASRESGLSRVDSRGCAPAQGAPKPGRGARAPAVPPQGAARCSYPQKRPLTGPLLARMSVARWRLNP
jgi:hypothetical protein